MLILVVALTFTLLPIAAHAGNSIGSRWTNSSWFGARSGVERINLIPANNSFVLGSIYAFGGFGCCTAWLQVMQTNRQGVNLCNRTSGWTHDFEWRVAGTPWFGCVPRNGFDLNANKIIRSSNLHWTVYMNGGPISWQIKINANALPIGYQGEYFQNAPTTGFDVCWGCGGHKKWNKRHGNGTWSLINNAGNWQNDGGWVVGVPPSPWHVTRFGG